MNISIENVSKQFSGKVVLEDISIHVEKSSLIALLGPSGCGKTTLLNALAGLVDIDGGRIAIGDTLYSERGYTLPPEQRKIGMVFQDFALWPHMNVYENVAFGLKVQKVPRARIRERVLEVLQVVRMSGFEKRFPHQLSGGQKQRVAIARALASEPAVILMDEPLSSLDAKLREEMRWQLMEIIRKSGITTIYVTHDQVEALTMADKIILLNQGRVEQEGTPIELYHSPKTEFCASFIGTSNLLPSRIVKHMGEWATVDVLGLPSVASVHEVELEQEAIFMVRPEDIAVVANPRVTNEQGTAVSAVILQRAFLGEKWQYRVRLRHESNISLEVADSALYEIGATVPLWIPREAARLLRKAETV